MSTKYPSKYTDKLVTTANHITEILMERLAKKEKRSLGPNFWLDETWKKQYNQCLVQVTRSLAAYSEKAIIQSIRDNEWAFTLTPLKNAIAKNQKQIELRESTKPEEIKQETVDSTVLEERKSFKTSKLGNLD